MNSRFPSLRARDFSEDESGVVLLETLLVIPFLTLLLFAIIYFGFLLHAASSMEDAVRVAARELASGRADDETNGTKIACSSVTGTTPSGAQSAEQIACAVVSSLPGDFQVTAYDFNDSGHGNAGDDAVVWLGAPRDSVVYMPEILNLSDAAAITSWAVLRMQETGD